MSLLEYTRVFLGPQTIHCLNRLALGAAAASAGPAHSAPQIGIPRRPSSPVDARASKQMKMVEPGNNAPGKKQSRQNIKQRRVREEKIIRDGYRANKMSAQKRLRSVQPIQTHLDTAKLPTARGAYTALNKPSPPKPCGDNLIEELRAGGFQYIAVDPSPGVKKCVQLDDPLSCQT